MSGSPFVHGGPVEPHDFLNRRRELRRLLNRLEKGQATAIVGQPHTGKTSLLHYVLNTAQRERVVGNKLNRCYFRELDSQLLGRSFGQPAFWNQVLDPLAAQFSSDSLRSLYAVAKENEFGAFTLKRLFTALEEENRRIVVMLDEFDAVLNHPILNSAEFYGSLRSLTSRYASLALIISTRRSLNQLNVQTQEINPHSSPYFNIFTELRLGPLPKRDVSLLLDRAGGRFSNQDRQFVMSISGRHPYLLQMAADILWEVEAEGRTGSARYLIASEELRSSSEGHFADTWRSWSNDERKVIIGIALAEMSQLVEDHSFEWTSLIEDISDYSPELRGLEKSGTVHRITRDRWGISQRAQLWWLADEIKRGIRDEISFDAWLEAQELSGILTQTEKRNMGQAALRVATFLARGASALIEAFAKGVGEGLGEVTLGRR